MRNEEGDRLSEKYAVSVIMPAYNAEAFLPGAVESINAQDLQVKEIVIVDDGSKDQTEAVAKSLPGPIRYIRQENAGPAAARNRGIAEATGNWVAFLDSDDRWLPDRLSGCAMTIEAEPELVWACAAYKEVWPDGRERVADPSRWQHLFAGGATSFVFFDAFLTGVPLITSGMFIRRDVFEEIGTFELGMRMGEDMDLWYRIALEFPRIGFSWPATTCYMQHDASLTSSAKDYTEVILISLERHTQRIEVLEAEKFEAFEPIVRRHAQRGLQHSVAVGRPDVARKIVREYGRWLSPKSRRLGALAGMFPGVVLRNMAWFYKRFRNASKAGEVR